MQWEQGHEKMITFGAALDVRKPDGTSKAKGVYCYSYNLRSTYAVYTGISEKWQNWAIKIYCELDKGRERLKDIHNKSKRQKIIEDIYESVIVTVYYQNGHYLTLPKEELTKIQEWIYKYLDNGKQDFPFDGKIPNEDIRFVIDFAADIEIVKSYNSIAEYNRENNKIHNQTHNITHNKDIGRKRVVDTFSRLVGDEWSRQEILNQGFTKGNLERFIEYGLIERIKQGYYRRKI